MNTELRDYLRDPLNDRWSESENTINQCRWIRSQNGFFIIRRLSHYKESEIIVVPHSRVRSAAHDFVARLCSVWVSSYRVLFLVVFISVMVLVFHDLFGSLLVTAILAFAVLYVFEAQAAGKNRSRNRVTVESSPLTLPIVIHSLKEGMSPTTTLLHRLSVGNPAGVRTEPRGVIAVFHESAWWRTNTCFWGLLAFGVVTRLLVDEAGLSLPQSIGVAGLITSPALAVVIRIVVGVAFDMAARRGLEPVCSALHDDKPEKAHTLLSEFLKEKPRHVYANFLMAVCALMEGDIYTAAEYRQAMHGDRPSFRLAELLFTLTHKVSSCAAFWALAAYVQRRERDVLPTVTTTESPH